MLLWRLRKPDKEVGPGKLERGSGQVYECFAHKPSDAVDRSKWREMIRGNWSDSKSDNDAESSIQDNCTFLVPALPG